MRVWRDCGGVPLSRHRADRGRGAWGTLGSAAHLWEGGYTLNPQNPTHYTVHYTLLGGWEWKDLSRDAAEAHGDPFRYYRMVISGGLSLHQDMRALAHGLRGAPRQSAHPGGYSPYTLSSKIGRKHNHGQIFAPVLQNNRCVPSPPLHPSCRSMYMYCSLL